MEERERYYSFTLSQTPHETLIVFTENFVYNYPLILLSLNCIVLDWVFYINSKTNAGLSIITDNINHRLNISS
jgi:hypothetical protein